MKNEISLRKVINALATTLLAGVSLAAALVVATALFEHRLLLWNWFNVAALLVLPAILAVAGLRLCRRGGGAAIPPALSIVSLTFSLYAVEVLFVALEPASGHLAVGSDPRSKLEVLTDLRSEGKEAFPSINPKDLFNPPQKIGGMDTAPLSSLSNVTTVFCNEIGKYYVYESDEHGFANPPGSWSSPAPRLLLIGDSFTQGFCVPDGGSYAEILRTRAGPLLNLGMNGNGPLIELASLREYGRSVRPARVVWFYFEGNDPVDLSNEMTSQVLMRYLLEPGFSQKLMERRDEVQKHLRQWTEERVQEEMRRHAQPRFRRALQRIEDQAQLWSRLWHVRRLLHLVHLKREWPLYQFNTAVSDEGAREIFRRVLGEAKATVESWGGELTFVYIPALRTFSHGVVHPWRDWVLASAAEHGIRTIDLLPSLTTHPDPRSLYIPTETGHFTRDGNEFVADLVLRGLGGDRVEEADSEGAG